MRLGPAKRMGGVDATQRGVVCRHSDNHNDGAGCAAPASAAPFTPVRRSGAFQPSFAVRTHGTGRHLFQHCDGVGTACGGLVVALLPSTRAGRFGPSAQNSPGLPSAPRRAPDAPPEGHYFLFALHFRALRWLHCLRLQRKPVRTSLGILFATHRDLLREVEAVEPLHAPPGRRQFTPHFTPF